MALTVLQLVPSLKEGGVEVGTVDLARQLVLKGHRAIVISSGGPLVRDLEAAGAIHYTLPIHQKLPFGWMRMVHAVVAVVESHAVDVIHARSRVPAWIGWLAWRRVARRVSFRSGLRQTIPCFITTAHGHYARHPFSRVMGFGRIVIANSHRIARHMEEAFGVPRERIRVIHRGVDLSQFSWSEPRLDAPKGEWTIAVIGRITPIKGHRDLLIAFGIVSKTFPRARLWVVGDPDPRHQNHFKQLQSLTEQLGLRDLVEFKGHESDIPRLLRQVDLVVLPSVGEEAFGRVLIEAGASGVPVVATRVGGIPEIILDRKSGLLVPPSDPMALASAITTLLKDRELARRLAYENRRRIEEHFTLSRMVDKTLQVYQETSERLKILVMKLSASGDVVLATPSLRALRERFPKAHITVLVGRDHWELLHRCPYIDDWVVFDPKRDGTLGGLLKLGRRLRNAQVDLVVDLQNNRVSHWLGWLSGAPQRYGWAGRRFSRLLTHPIPPVLEPISPVEHQFRLLQWLGIQAAPFPLELWPGPEDEKRSKALLEKAWLIEGQPLIAVHPGARWPSKRWPAKHYAQMVDLVAMRANARVVLVGTESERAICEAIHRMAQVKPIVAAGATSLNELAALLKRCRVFVGGDSAPLHVAAAMGVPLVTLFGPTDPVRHLPPSPRLKLIRLDLPCSPCYRRICPRYGRGHMECMERISPEVVTEAVVGQLG
jgi:lipopolysaccharide heptosyltransferase II